MVSVQFSVIINDTKLRKRIKSQDRWGSIELNNLTKKEAEAGARYARTIAPKDTGALKQAIPLTPVSNRGGRGSKGYSVISRTPGGGNTRKRPYHMMMHGLRSPSIRHKIRSGDPEYMFSTAQWLATNYPRKVRESLKRKLKQTR